MANKKSSKNSKSTKTSTKAKSGQKSLKDDDIAEFVGKEAKKAYKKNPKAVVISIVAVVLVIAITLAVIYFAFPDTWADIVSIFDKSETGNNTLARGDGELLVHMIDVGQGDCIYIQLPDGKDMVIDGGSTKRPAGNKDFDESNVIEYLNGYIKDGTIEYLMLTHTDEDHVKYLPAIIDEYVVENIYMPNALATPNLSALTASVRAEFEAIPAEKKAQFTDPDTVSTAIYAEFFVAALNEDNCNIVINMDENANTNTIVLTDATQSTAATYEFKFYCPTKAEYEENHLKSAEELNAVSPIGILSYNDRKVMFTGDSNKENEPSVMRRTGEIDCDVLKVGHHGSEASTSDSFLAQYTFEYAMISCGEHMGHKHPRQATLDRLKNHNVAVYRTDKQGNIVLSVDKTGKLTFRTDRECSEAELWVGRDVEGASTASAIPSYFAGVFFINKARVA